MQTREEEVWIARLTSALENPLVPYNPVAAEQTAQLLQHRLTLYRIQRARLVLLFVVLSVSSPVLFFGLAIVRFILMAIEHIGFALQTVLVHAPDSSLHMPPLAIVMTVFLVVLALAAGATGVRLART